MRENIDNKSLIKERILKKADFLFSAYGIKNITMDEIASSLGISKRTLYEVVKDKEDLLLACIERSQNEMHEYVDGVLEKTSNVIEVIILCYKATIKKYHKVNTLFFEDIKKYPKAYERFLNGQKEDSQKSIDFFMRGVSQGLFRADVNFEIVHLLVKEQMNVLLDTKVNKKYSMTLIYESIVFTFLRGVSTPKGYSELDKFIRECKI